MARKLKTMERDFWFNLNPEITAAVNADYYIDLGQVASLVNRVSLRQGMEYVVESVSLVTNGSANIGVFRIPEHWPGINAWEKAYHVWQKSQGQVLDDNPSLAGRYRDFKVAFDQAHIFATNLIPLGYEIGPAATAYDWEKSDIQLPNFPTPGVTTGFELHMLGDKTATSMGIVNGYAASRARPQEDEPNLPHMDSWMIEAFDVGDNLPEIITDLRYENESPPYLVGDDGTSAEFYPGGEFQGLQDWTAAGMNPASYGGALEGILSIRGGTSAVGTTGMGGFVAPLGLLKLTVDAVDLVESASAPFLPGILPSLLLKVTLAPGGYKGLLAQGMRDVN